MIAENKASQALYALNGVLVQLRTSAFKSEDIRKIATVLDYLEELPRFLASNRDQTDEFESSLRALAERFPEFSISLERFLKSGVPEVW